MIYENCLKFDEKKAEAWMELAQQLKPGADKAEATRQLNAILAEMGVLVVLPIGTKLKK